MDDDLHAPRPIPPDWHAQELLVALVQAAGGELTFDKEHSSPPRLGVLVERSGM
ncbi:hypothetical protein [Streptomyces sp. NPDC056682]|uniref:hypothetical protein n=1 Tax=Streptomyces sp. NPDC056682 TaxID=3345909 RepID=UPI0036AC9527